jgi:glycosyltransferase involved in cell wall biosynthesis
MGHKIKILTEGIDSVEFKENFTTYFLQGTFTPFTSKFSSTRRVIPIYNDLFSPDIIVKAAKTLIKELDADVIYSCGPSFSSTLSAVLGHMTNIPTVHYVTDYTGPWRWWGVEDAEVLKGYYVPPSYLFSLFIKNAFRELPRRQLIHKWGLKNITQIIASSNFVKGRIIDSMGIKDIPVIYPGVKVPLLTTEISKCGEPLITYLGHLWQGRGILDLVVAFSNVIKKHPEVRMVVAASNIHKLTRYHFLRLVADLQLSPSVIEKGVVSNVYSEVMAPSTVIVLPYRDSPSMKLLESMAMAKPVITTRLGWASELIIDSENGFLVRPGDIEGLAEKIDMVLDNSELSIEISKKARETIENKCDIVKNASSILSVLEETIRRT